MIYEEGSGLAADLAQAARWYRKAADHGNRLAQNNLGHLFEKGAGVHPDIVEAIRLYKLAADQGEVMAWQNLARVYAGASSLSPDNNVAYFWARITSAGAPDQALKNGPAFVDLLRKRLSIEDAQRIEARAEQWIQEHRPTWNPEGELIFASIAGER